MGTFWDQVVHVSTLIPVVLYHSYFAEKAFYSSVTTIKQQNVVSAEPDYS